jgi:hypothetical protein
MKGRSELELERERLDALDMRDAEEDSAWRERYSPGTCGCHEALHVSSIVANLIADRLMEHGAVIQNPEWYRLAQQAHSAMFDLYQAIGAVHLTAEPSKGS